MPAQHNWTIQFLITEESARFIRDCINYYRVEAEAKGNLTAEDNDTAWELIALMMEGIREAK